MNRLPAQSLRDAREMALQAASYSRLSAEALAKEGNARYSVLYCLIVIGEALNGIPQSVKSLAPEIRWREIIDMRHILVHSYWRTDYTIVHGVLTRELAPFVEAIDRLLVLVEKS